MLLAQHRYKLVAVLSF